MKDWQSISGTNFYHLYIYLHSLFFLVILCISYLWYLKIWLCTFGTKVYCHFNAFLRHKYVIVNIIAYQTQMLLLWQAYSYVSLWKIDRMGLYERYRGAFRATVLYQSDFSAPTDPAPVLSVFVQTQINLFQSSTLWFGSHTMNVTGVFFCSYECCAIC